MIYRNVSSLPSVSEMLSDVRTGSPGGCVEVVMVGGSDVVGGSLVIGGSLVVGGSDVVGRSDVVSGSLVVGNSDVVGGCVVVVGDSLVPGGPVVVGVGVDRFAMVPQELRSRAVKAIVTSSIRFMVITPIIIR